MGTLLNLTKRNIKMYSRDRINVLLSFTSVLILIMLYLLFLGSTLESSFLDLFDNLVKDGTITKDEYNADDIKIIVNSLMVAGILFMNALNLPITILGRMAVDKNSKAIRDFYVTPVSKTTIMFGYILSALVITFVFNIITLALGQLYIIYLGGEMWSVEAIGLTLLFSTVAIIIFSSLIMLLLTFIKNETQLSLLSTILGVLSGFVSGLYVPFIALSKGFANILSTLPFAGISSLIKQSLLGGTVDSLVSGIKADAVKESLKESINEVAGIQLYYNDEMIPAENIYLTIAAFTLVVLSLAAFRLSNSKEK